MRKKIVKSAVDGAVATAGKPIFIFDTELPGFTLKITPTGRKVFQLRYRMGGRAARLVTYTIGRYGALTPEQARKIAKKLVGMIADGTNPAEVKKRDKQELTEAPTISRLSKDFLDLYGATKLKPRTLTEYRRNFNSHINPAIGHLKVRDTAHSDVERLQHSMRDTPPTANRSTSCLSAFFSWAIRSGYRPDRLNPVSGLKKYKEEPRRRYLSRPEMSALGAAIQSCEQTENISVWQGAFFRCLLLTALRRDELRTLRWRQVDLDRGVILLEDSKVGRREVPISLAVIRILQALPQINGNPYVFCGARAASPLINIAKCWKRILKEAKIAHARPHDLRHTAASVAVSAGASIPLIGGVLGHRSSMTTERYAHLAPSPVRATAETIGAEIAPLLAITSPPRGGDKA
ncbi:site-specific integrase [Hyphomicrobium sp.]|uniref:tyrosine-type recombinase/integrase n=1 Tax=Hyphomicrobium sp. TaxID=82 RepID=UPI000FAB148D|nr:site-specific integrase [Hyphomicrobium sp.]RUO97999.1 MAG: DUF4102 domain-containing protein [Hyphomicrobium sp.]